MQESAKLIKVVEIGGIHIFVAYVLCKVTSLVSTDFNDLVMSFEILFVRIN